MQLVRDEVSCFPAAQSAQLVRDEVSCFPDGHAMHSAPNSSMNLLPLPAGWYRPGSHATQVLPDRYWPLEQPHWPSTHGQMSMLHGQLHWDDSIGLAAQWPWLQS